MTTASGVLAEKTKPKFLAPFTNAPSSEINDKSQLGDGLVVRNNQCQQGNVVPYNTSTWKVVYSFWS